MTYVATLIGANLFLKATVILAVATIVTTVLKRSSAATRHAIWSGALVALVVLPIMELVLPSWRLQSLSVMTVVTEPVSTTAASTAETAALIEVPVASAESVDSLGLVWGEMLAVALLSVWLAGALLILGRLAIHAVHVSRMTAAGEQADHALRDKVVAIARSLGCRASIQVTTCDELAIPASWGVFKPVILLPSNVSSWPAERLHAVIVHELAHIKRHDYAFHLLAEIAHAIYWLNPLVWLAAHRSGIERERACDDVALQSGVAREAYATRLLEIARLTLRFPSDSTAGAIAMARRSGLRERVKSILAHSANRTPVGSAKLAVIAIVAATVALPVAALQVGQDRPPSISELLDDLQSDDATVARRAAWWLGEREDPSTVDALIETLRDGHPDVRLVAAWALGEIKDPRAIDALAQALESDDPLFREMATLSLGETEHPDALRPLMDAFDENPDLRPAVYWALGEISTEEAKAARHEAANILERAPVEHTQVWTGRHNPNMKIVDDVAAHIRSLSAESAKTRRNAALSLGVLGAFEAIDHLLDALRDPDPSVRAMAVWALDEINPSRPRH